MATALIDAVRSVVGAQPNHRRIAEEATQTFLDGTPVEIDIDGFVIEWDVATWLTAAALVIGVDITPAELAALAASDGIAGVSKENASNLTTAGVPQTLTYGGHPPNQPYAVKIPAGAPLNDGRIGFDTSDGATIFKGQVGPSQTTSAVTPGNVFCLTKDTDGHWYVDTTSTTYPVVEIVSLDTYDTARGVYFKFLPVAQQGVV